MLPFRRLGRALTGLFARLRSTSRGLRHGGEVDAEMEEEFRHHLELRTEDLVRRGLSPTEARRRAHLEFGHAEALQEEARAARGLGPFDRLGLYWLDVKLGLRMIRKYPGLSIISVAGMAIAIAVGAGWFGFIEAMVVPTLPLDEGHRVVSLQNDDLRSPGNPDLRAAPDFLSWREELRSVEELSAYAEARRNLILPNGRTELVTIAQMTASGFEVARVRPALGRTLLEEDERPGAPPVVVIGHDAWQGPFEGDPDVLGRFVQLGTVVHEVVGVMPEGFAFPVNHRYWTPLQLDRAGWEVGGGPEVRIFAETEQQCDRGRAASLRGELEQDARGVEGPYRGSVVIGTDPPRSDGEGRTELPTFLVGLDAFSTASQT